MFWGNNQKKKAKELLVLASKVYHYKRDLLSPSQIETLQASINQVEGAIKSKDVSNEVILSNTDELEKILREYGGTLYPKTFLSENVEMLLVCAIVVLGLRAFFFQPFIIPTNSMYPTYNGMQRKALESGEEPPNIIKRIFTGARHYHVKAEKDGVLKVNYRIHPISDSRSALGLESTPGRGFPIPTRRLKYTLFIDDEPLEVKLPPDFPFEKVLMDKYFDGLNPQSALLRAYGGERNLSMAFKQSNTLPLVLNKEVKKGEDILNFLLYSGDALFVDRISYHFFPPKVGDPFVFKTGNVPGLQDEAEKYYIKRLVGEGSDTLQVVGDELLRNGKPNEGSEAFELNAKKVENYGGYQGAGNLVDEEFVKIPNDHYFALGDNSYNSRDSRYWGFVPKKEVIGKAMFIYYPFSHRWGISE